VINFQVVNVFPSPGVEEKSLGRSLPGAAEITFSVFPSVS
jgi:hypothetical protein